MPKEDTSQDCLYEQAAEAYSSSLARLARAYELNTDARRDLLQDIHFHLWRSFSNFDQRCSLRTWVYRVAHNVATGHVIRQRRLRETLVDLEDFDSLEDRSESHQTELVISQSQSMERLWGLIQRLKPLDRQIIVSYLEGMPASDISGITGLTAANIAMKIHRIKKILQRWFGEGGVHGK